MFAPLVRESLRHLFKYWRSNAAVLLTIAVGASLALTVFLTLDAFLWADDGVVDTSRLVHLRTRRSAEKLQSQLAAATFGFVQRTADCFSSVAAFRSDNFSVESGGAEQNLRGGCVNAEFFATYGAVPTRGRFFSPEEIATDAPVVVLSSQYWRSAFGGDETVLGRTVKIGRTNRTVIGIVDRPAREFEEVSLWVPLGLGKRLQVDHTYPAVSVVARLRAGYDLVRAQQRLDQLSTTLRAEEPNQIAKEWTLLARSRRDEQSAPIRPVLWLLIGAGLGSLLAAGMNAAAVRLVRFAAAEPQLAIKRALGATNLTLAVPMLLEGVFLAVTGVLLGAGGARTALALLAKDSTNLLRWSAEFASRSHLYWACGAMIALFAVLLLWVPLRRLRRQAWSHLLQQRHASERELLRFQRAAIVIQLSLAFTLLVGGARMLRGWQDLRHVDLGFDATRATIATLGRSPTESATPEQNRLLGAALERELSALDGIDHAAVCIALPLTPGWMLPYYVNGAPVQMVGELPRAAVNFVSPGYLPTMGLRLRSGRWFTAADTDGAQWVAVINTTLARTHFPQGDAVGKWIYPAHDEKVFRLIVGVVDDVRLNSLTEPVVPQIYEPFAQHPRVDFTLVLSTPHDRPAPTLAALRATLARLAPHRPLGKVYRMQEYQDGQLARPRFAALVVLTVALFSVVLCIAGFASLVAYATTRRTREFGLRIALGATARDIFGGILGESLRLGAAGALLGAVGAFLLNQTLDKLVTLPAQAHLAAYGLAAAVLVIVTFLATAAPAWRASRIDPAIALREE